MARFVDTNILLYAITTAAEEAAKARIARELLDQPDGQDYGGVRVRNPFLA